MSHEDQSKALISKLISSGEIVNSQSSPATVFMGEIESAKMSSAKIENVVFEKLALQDVLFKESVFRNVTFNNCVFHKVDFDDSALENVVFNNCRIKSFNPVGATFKNVKFIRSKIHSASLHSSSGKILAEESDFYHLNLGKSQVEWTITNSTLNKIEAFKIGGSITLKDSTFTDANLEFGEMDSFEAYNSTIDALGPGTLRDKLIVNGGKIQWTGIMNVPHADIADVKIDRLSLGYGHVGHVSIRNCGRVNTLGFSRTFFESISVSNCDVGYFGAFASRIKNLSFDNVAIDEMEAEEAQIGVWRATNVQLNGNLEFQHSKVSDTRFDRLTIGRKATLLNEGANFIFP